jgi:hypothetical protein
VHWEQLIDEGRGGKDELWIIKKSTQEKRRLQMQEQESHQAKLQPSPTSQRAEGQRIALM